MHGVELRELECFLVLSEELHFGRAAERMHLSQGRASQLLRSLERRIGARLMERTSRRVRLTPLGATFLEELRAPHEAIRAAVERARAEARGVDGLLRVGFLGTLDVGLTELLTVFRDRHPGTEVQLVELPLTDPFGPLRRGDADTAIVTLPVEEPDLVIGSTFSKQPQMLGVSVRHSFAGRDSVTAEGLADCRMIGIAEPAPRYWRETFSPTETPEGRAVPQGPAVRTFQEGLTAVAANRGAMLYCVPTAAALARSDVAFVPVTGLPDSTLGLIWHRDTETARLTAFRRVVAEHAPAGP